MAIEVKIEEDTIPVRTMSERAQFWVKYGAMLAWRHEQGNKIPESDLLEQIKELSMNSREWIVLPSSNEELLENIIRNISSDELKCIYDYWYADMEREAKS